MKKTLLTFLLLLTTVATPLWAATKTVTVGSIVYNIDEENLTAEVGSNANITGTSKRTFNIPSTFTYSGKTYTVTSIQSRAFYNDTTIISITVPGTVTKVNGEFTYVKNLQELHLSEGLVEWSGSTLQYTKLVNLVFPKSLKAINSGITLPKSIKYICIKNPDMTIGGDLKISYSYYSSTTLVTYSKTPNFTYATSSGSSRLFQKVFVPRGCKEVYSAIKPWSGETIEEFGAEEAEQAELRIAQGDYGSVVMNVDKGVQHTIKLECGEGWKIARVMFNETDMTDNLDADNSFTTPEITDDSNLLSVTYEESLAGVETVTDDANVSVTARHGLITVSGATAGTRISVYDLSGALQSPAITAAGSGSEMIETAPGAVRIVRVGSRTFKVMP